MTKHILLICADQRQAVRVQVALLRCGCLVEVASTFRRGLAVIQHRPPWAIVVDERLPELDSAVLERVLATNPAATRPTVVMLALHEPAAPRAIELGGEHAPIDAEPPDEGVVAALRIKGVL